VRSARTPPKNRSSYATAAALRIALLPPDRLPHRLRVGVKRTVQRRRPPYRRRMKSARKTFETRPRVNHPRKHSIRLEYRRVLRIGAVASVNSKYQKAKSQYLRASSCQRGTGGGGEGVGGGTTSDVCTRAFANNIAFLELSVVRHAARGIGSMAFVYLRANDDVRRRARARASVVRKAMRGCVSSRPGIGFILARGGRGFRKEERRRQNS
jgi:hypothetical protein